MRNRSKKRKKLSRRLLIITFFSLISLILINFKLLPIVYKKCEFEINKLANDKINNAITKVIEKYGYNYDDYVTIKTSNTGNILAIYTNAKQITLIHTAIIDEINKELSKDEFHHVDVSLGSLTGLLMFSSRGPKIPIKISYKGLSNSEIISSLKEAGINQTLHKLHIHVFVDIVGFLPFHAQKLKVESDCMLCESLIVGQVPQHYTKIVSSEKNNNLTDKSYKFDEDE